MVFTTWRSAGFRRERNRSGGVPSRSSRRQVNGTSLGVSIPFGLIGGSVVMPTGVVGLGLLVCAPVVPCCVEDVSSVSVGLSFNSERDSTPAPPHHICDLKCQLPQAKMQLGLLD